MTRHHTAAKPKATSASASARRAAAEAAETHDWAAAPSTASHSEHSDKNLTLTIPLNRDAVNTAAQTTATAVMVPVTAAKNVLQSRKAGVPAYLGIAGLAAVGVVEWPVAAVAGAGLAYMRRWGPLRPETARPPQPKVMPADVTEPYEAHEGYAAPEAPEGQVRDVSGE